MLASALIISAPARAEIREILHIADVLEQGRVDGETLVLTDLDMTAIRTRSYLGSDVWFEHLVRRIQRVQGLTFEEAIPLAQTRWHEAQRAVKSEAMEGSTVSTLADLSRRAGAMLALTARNPQLHEFTLSALAQSGLRQGTLTESLGRAELALPHPAALRDGVVFVGRNSKGEGLTALLPELDARAGFCPRRLIMIDDRRSHLEGLERAAREAGIEFVGYHYLRGQDRANRLKARHPLTHGLARTRAEAREFRARLR